MKPSRAKRIIRRDVEGWRSSLGLSEWTLHLAFERHDDGEVASCTATWEYHEARLSFDAKQMVRRGLDRDDIRRTVLHEMLHCVCNGYERWHEDALLEEMVSKLTTTLIRCWEAPSRRR